MLEVRLTERPTNGGDVWKKRSRRGQTERILKRLRGLHRRLLPQRQALSHG